MAGSVPEGIPALDCLVPVFEDPDVEQSGDLDGDHLILLLGGEVGAPGEEHCILLERGFQVRLVDVPLCAVVQDHGDAYISRKVPWARKEWDIWLACSMVLPAVNTLQ